MSQHFTSQSLFPFNHHMHQCDVQQYHQTHARRASLPQQHPQQHQHNQQHHHHQQQQQQHQQQQQQQQQEPQQQHHHQQQQPPDQHHQHLQHHHQQQLAHIAQVSTGRAQFIDNNQHIVAHFTNHYNQFAVEPLSVTDATNQFMSAIQQQNPQLQDSTSTFSPVSFFVQQQSTTTSASTSANMSQLTSRQHSLSYQHGGSMTSLNHTTTLNHQHHDHRAPISQQIQPRQDQQIQSELSTPVLVMPSIGCNPRSADPDLTGSMNNKSGAEAICSANDSITSDQQLHQQPLASYRGSNNKSKNSNYTSSNKKYKAENRVKNCDSPRRTFECPVCGKSFTEKFNMKRHMQIHSQSRPKYICNECSKSFAWKDNFIRHKKAAHETNVTQFSL